jgi:glycosyltransferase involved in cell wall biosynthesis
MRGLTPVPPGRVKTVLAYLQKVVVPLLLWQCGFAATRGTWLPRRLFDEDFYVDAYPDVAASGMHPFRHFLIHGILEGRNPCVFFDSGFYLRNYPDVAATGMIPLIHYLLHGSADGRCPSPFFDPAYYRENSPDVTLAGQEPLIHYLKFGAAEGRHPNPYFDNRMHAGKAPGRFVSPCNPLDDQLLHESRADLAHAADPRRMLIVDQQLPTPDRDSGSLRMFSLIEILRAQGYAVTLASHRNESLGGNHAQNLRDMGVALLAGPSAVFAHFQAYGGLYAHIILSRPETAHEYLPLARAYALHANVIYDTVDLHWIREGRMAQVLNDPKAFELSIYHRKVELAAANRADLVFTVTEQERQVLLAEGVSTPVAVIPNVHKPAPFSRPFAARHDLLFVGSFNHPPNIDAVAWFVEKIFPLIQREIPEIAVHIIGSDAPDRIKAMASPGVNILGYQASLGPWMQECRISVAPLRYGAGMKGKIGQSMSEGLPVVTTSLGAEGMHLQNEIDVLIADGEEPFAKSVIRLYRDEALWNVLSARALAYIASNLSPLKTLQRLEAALAGLNNKAGRAA